MINFLQMFFFAILHTLYYKPLVIHARSYMPSFIGFAISRIFNMPFVFDMRGFWIDERIEGKIWKKNIITHILIKILRKLETLMIKKSEYVVVLTDDAKQILEDNYERKNNIYVIPCASSIIMEPSHVPDNVIMTHGVLTDWYDLPLLFHFFREFIHQCGGRVIVLTRDIEKAYHLSQEYGIPPDKITIKHVSHEQVVEYIKRASAGIVFLKNGFAKMGSFPIRMAEYICCGVPVICNNVGGLKFVEKHQCGIVIKNLTPDYISANIREIIKQATSLDKRHIYETGKKQLSVEAIGHQYIRLYNKIAQKNL